MSQVNSSEIEDYLFSNINISRDCHIRQFALERKNCKCIAHCHYASVAVRKMSIKVLYIGTKQPYSATAIRERNASFLWLSVLAHIEHKPILDA